MIAGTPGNSGVRVNIPSKQYMLQRAREWGKHGELKGRIGTFPYKVTIMRNLSKLGGNRLKVCFVQIVYY